MTSTNFSKGEVVIYKSPKGPEIKVRLDRGTVWLDAHLIAKIFGVQRSAVVKHIHNIYGTQELNEESTCSKMEQVASDGKIRKMNLYNLDIIISIGYRVNSLMATQFRIWASSVLKKYLIEGYAVNEKRLLEVKNKFNELQEAVLLLQKQSKKERLEGKEAEILNLLADYSKMLSLLNQYDKKAIKSGKGQKGEVILEYENCKKAISTIKKEVIKKGEAGELFGQESGGNFEGIVKGLYSTFAKEELYLTIEDKASHLLYLVIKDHPFLDGNKRIASFLFVYYLDMSKYLYKKSGERKINDNALIALSLLVAESNSQDKEIMIKIIKSLLAN